MTSLAARTVHESQDCSQKARAEHQNDLDLFLVVEGQADQGLDWETDDRQVHRDLHCGLVPGVCADVDAAPCVLACPARPEEWNRSTLEDHDKDVGNTEAS